MYLLRTFGAAPCLTKSGESVPLGQREFMLLVFLLVEARKRYPRDEVAQLIWHGVHIKAARHSLAQALYTLRKILPELQLSVTNTELTFDTGTIVCDVSAFEKAVAENDFDSACSIYAGSFLGSTDISSNSAFQDWCDRTRDRLMAAWQHLLESTAERQTAAGDWDRVFCITEKLLELCPSCVRWHRAKVEALYMRGDLVQANEAIASLRLQCAGEPELDRTIADLRQKLSRPPMSKRPFVGRQTELQVLDECWARSRTSGPETTIVIGEAGIGKTTLVAQFLKYAAIRGARTEILKCDRRTQHAPYSIVFDLIRALEGVTTPSDPNQVAREIAAGRRSDTNVPDSAALRERIADDLYEVLVNASEYGICVFLDDADNADRSSLEILAELQRSQPPYAVHLILAMRRRAEQGAPELWELFSPGVSVIDLGELSDADAARLLELLTTSEPAKKHHPAILSSAGGHPFYLTSLAASLREHPAGLQTRVPGELTEHIKHRIAGLSTEAKSVLFAAAFCPGRSDLDHIIAATRTSEEQALAAVEELTAQRFLSVRGFQIALVHSLFKDVAEQIASPIRVALYHERIADHLAANKSALSLIAYHYEKAGRWVTAGRYLLAALRYACRLFALPEAEALFSRLLAATPSRRLENRGKRLLGKLYFELRRFEEAARTFASIPEPRTAYLNLDLQIARVAASLDTSGVDVVAHQLQTAATEAAAIDAHPAVVNALVNLANVLTLSGPPEILRAVAQQLQKCIEQAKLAPVQRVIAQTVVGQLLAITGDLDKGKEIVSLALSDSAVASDWRARVRANGAMGVICLLSSLYKDAVVYLGRAIEQCSEAHADRWRLDQLSNYGIALWCAGNVEAADSVFRELVESGPRRNPLRSCTALVNLAEMWYDVGNHEKARWFASRTLAEGGDRLGRVAMAAWAILGLVALDESRIPSADAAHEKLQTLWAAMGPPPTESYISLFAVRYLRIKKRCHEANMQLQAVLALPVGDEVIRNLLLVEGELLHA